MNDGILDDGILDVGILDVGQLDVGQLDVGQLDVGQLEVGQLDVGQLDVAHELQQEQVPPLPLALALRPEHYMEHRPQLVFHKELPQVLEHELRKEHQYRLLQELRKPVPQEPHKEHPLVLQLEQGKEYERHKEQGHKQEPPPVRILR